MRTMFAYNVLRNHCTSSQCDENPEELCRCRYHETPRCVQRDARRLFDQKEHPVAHDQCGHCDAHIDYRPAHHRPLEQRAHALRVARADSHRDWTLFRTKPTSFSAFASDIASLIYLIGLLMDVERYT